MNLDLAASIGCCVVAVSAALVHSASGPDFKSWVTLPKSIRGGIAAVGGALFLYSVDLFTLAQSGGPPWPPGHMNLIGLANTMALAFLALACVHHILIMRLRQHGWERLGWAMVQLRKHPELRPTMLTANEVEDVARVSFKGTVNAKGGRPPKF